MMIDPEDGGDAREGVGAATSTSPRSKGAGPQRGLVTTSVVLPLAAFRVCWWLVIFYHMFNACFLTVCGVAHLVLATPAVYASTWMLAIQPTTLVVSGWTYLALACVHLFSMGLNIWQSIVQGRLSLRFDSQRKVPPPLFNHITAFRNRTLQASGRFSLQQALQRLVSYPLVIWDRYLGEDGYFGINGAYFDVWFHARQVVEIFFQTYQARVISDAVPERRVNHLAVAMVVVNCIYTPVVDYTLRNKPAMCRLVTLWIDIALEFSFAVVLPIYVLLPRFKEYNGELGRFPQELTYNDYWVASTVSEARQALVTSFMDYVTSMTPHLIGLLSLATIKSMLRCSSTRVSTSKTAMTLRRLATRFSMRSPLAASSSRIDPRRKLRTTLKGFSQSRTSLTIINVATVTWALAVVVVHLSAARKPQIAVDACDIHVHAWFASLLTCSVARINCYRDKTPGLSDDMTAILALLDRSALTKLVFSHCSALEVPPIITEFPRLRAFEVFNSTIVRWEADAAVTRHRMRNLVHIQLIETNMTEIPAGLMHDQLPVDMNLAIYRSNLSVLPEDIGHLWADVRWITFWIEHTQLSALPASFIALPMTKLSLVANQLTTLPDALLQGKRLAMLRVSENPLHALPAMFSDTSALTHVYAEDTMVSEIPRWLEDWELEYLAGSNDRRVHVGSLHGSPYCAQDGGIDKNLCQIEDALARSDFRFDLVAAQRPIVE